MGVIPILMIPPIQPELICNELFSSLCTCIENALHSNLLPLIWPRPKGMKGNCPFEIPKQRAGW